MADPKLINAKVNSSGTGCWCTFQGTGGKIVTEGVQCPSGNCKVCCGSRLSANFKSKLSTLNSALKKLW